MRMRLFSILVLVACAAGLLGCAANQLVNLWSDPSYRGTMTKVVILAMSKDAINRHIVEDAFVAEVARSGVSATPSYRTMQDAKPSEDVIRAMVREGGFDGALVVRTVGVDQRTTYTPGWGYGYGYPGPMPGPYWGTFTGWYNQVYMPPGVYAYTVQNLEVTAWDTTGDGKVVWAGTFESYDSNAVASAAADIARMTAQEMAKKGLLPARRG